MTQTPIQTAAAELANAFETRTRDSGETFITLKDQPADWMINAVHAAHLDLLPNNHSYLMARRVTNAIVEELDEDTDADDLDALDIVSPLIPDNTFALTSWLASSNTRYAFCDEARDEGLTADRPDVLDLLAAGYREELLAIFAAIKSAIVERAEELEEESETAEG